jgi:uncharacterized protein (DUF2252 family)
MKTSAIDEIRSQSLARGDSVLVAVLEANRGRDPERVRLKVARMAGDPFAFFRGSCHRFVSAWPQLRPPDAGPPIRVCGDLHVENFGAYRDDAGKYCYDINDFDEAAHAPCAVDPTRCATSILLAADSWRLSPLAANGLVLAYLDRYQSAVESPLPALLAETETTGAGGGPIWRLLGKHTMSAQSALLDRHTERTRDGTRRIARDKGRHPRLDPERRELALEAMHAYGKARGQEDFFAPIDVSGRVCGVGSLGVERYLVLVSGGGSSETNQLFDIKECLASAWEAQEHPAPDPAREARRVVDAQRILQYRPTAGLDVFPMGKKTYRIREMIPVENRSRIERFRKKPRKLLAAIETAGVLTGLAHLRAASDRQEVLVGWARGAALDSVLVAAARLAEKTRRDFEQFRQEIRAPEALSAELAATLTGERSPGRKSAGAAKSKRPGTDGEE